MKKIICSLLLVLVFSVQHAGAQVVRWKLADLQSAIANAKGPTIFNFWATFCKPCVAEIPYFETLVKKYEKQGVHLVLVSLDLKEAYPAKIKSFAAKHQFHSPIKFLDETNADLFCPAVDSRWSGSIPSSLFVNHQKGYKQFYEEQLSKDKLEAAIKLML